MRWSTSFSYFKIRNGKGSGWVRAGFFHTQTRNPDPSHLLNGFFSQGPNSPQRASLNPAKFGPIHGPNSGPTKKKKLKNIPQLFLNVLGNQTLQSKTRQTQKHYNPEQYKLRILLPILVNFFFPKLFLSLNLKIGTPWPDFRASQLAVHHCSPLFFPFATRNSSFPTVQNRNSMAKLFFLFTSWPTFLSLLSISHFKLSVC